MIRPEEPARNVFVSSTVTADPPPPPPAVTLSKLDPTPATPAADVRGVPDATAAEAVPPSPTVTVTGVDDDTLTPVRTAT
jgi:hypothetical protein